MRPARAATRRWQSGRIRPETPDRRRCFHRTPAAAFPRTCRRRRGRAQGRRLRARHAGYKPLQRRMPSSQHPSATDARVDRGLSGSDAIIHTRRRMCPNSSARSILTLPTCSSSKPVAPDLTADAPARVLNAGAAGVLLDAPSPGHIIGRDYGTPQRRRRRERRHMQAECRQRVPLSERRQSRELRSSRGPSASC